MNFESKRMMAVLVAVAATAASGQSQSWSVSGNNAGDIAPTVDSFRDTVSLGGGVNAPGSGPFANGRRQINWDAAGLDAFESPGFMPGGFFNVNSPRGAHFTTTGDGLMVSKRQPANPSDLRFGDINPAFANDFKVFSETRLFASKDSTIIDTTFFLPSDPAQQATVNGFGAVFTDVDLASTSSLKFYDIDDNLLHEQFALTGDNGLSFAAAFWDDGTRIARVRMTMGDTAMSDYVGIGDVVVLDDLIYGEPQAVPAPASALLLAGGAGVMARRRRRQI